MNKDWKEIKDFRDKLNASIDRFIQAIPTMDNEQVQETMDKYLAVMPKGFDNDNYLDYAIQNLKQRVEKALNAVDTFNMPKFLIPNVEPTEYNIKNDLVLYCQVAQDFLCQTKADPMYAHLIDKEKEWYYNDICNRFAPILAKVKNYPLDVAIEGIRKVWNIVVSNFQIE